MLNDIGSAAATALNDTASAVAWTVAETTWGEPEIEPVVKVVAACPSGPVVTVELPTLPSPCATANTTVALGIGLSPVSLTCTTSGEESSAPAGPVWLSPEIFWISAGVWVTETWAAALTDPAEAVTWADPAPSAVTRPVWLTLATDGLLLVQPAVSGGRVFPS